MLSENEFRVIGPPGTGKTTYLSSQVTRAIEAGRRPLVTSLTRAAAFEIGSRIEVGWDFAEDQVGTLHGHCFRALGCPELISKAEHVESWNEYIGDSNPAWELSPGAFVANHNDDAGRAKAAIGDSLFHAYSIFRAKLVSESLWPIEIHGFASKFEEWKRLTKLLDFTDLVAHCLRDVSTAPFTPDVIFVDEAQDHDRLELALVRKWATGVDQLIVCGDPDQNLYEFRGAEPEAFYAHEIPQSHYRILSQSYRVPKSVHAVSMEMIRRDGDRREVDYQPRDFAGEARRLWVRLRQCHEIVAEAMTHVERGKSVMVLATCEYMLGGLIKHLRDAGLPFHNPYAPNRGGFNPLGDRNGVTSPQRLLAFLRSSPQHYGEAARRWTWAELNCWADPLSLVGFLKHGAKKKLEELATKKGDVMIDGAGLRELLDPKGAAELQAIEGDPLGWFRGRLNASRRKAFDFPFAVIERRGVKALTEKPQIILGTIHSVKGGEADVVMLFPDLSPEGADTLGRNPASIYRAFYVGMTRAKETLLLGQNSSSMAIRWKD